jgi:outer membrane protein
MSWQAQAEEKALPLWEFGVGAGAFTLPQYMGSDERYTYPFVFPYLIYRGERWRLDRSGLRNRLFDSDRLSLDLSLSGGLPVRNSNKARQGMPELFLTGEIGPRLNWMLAKSDSDSWSLHLPSRAAINTRGKYVGWVTDPYLRYAYNQSVDQGLMQFKFDIGALYGSKRYHDIYYGVAPIYSTATRPTYVAKAGLHSVFAKARIRYPLTEKLGLVSSLQVRSLAVSVVKDSPLVKQKTYTSAALGLVWLFAESDEKVMREE